MKLTPTDLINLAIATMDGHLDRAATAQLPQGSVQVAFQPPVSTLPGWDTFKLTSDERIASILRAASIMFAESGGDSAIINYNKRGPNGQPMASKIGPADPKLGRDRGLWQINDKAWPDISDQAALDPHQSSELTWLISSAFRSWGPWAKSKGMDPTSEPSKTVRAAYESMLGRVIDDTPILSQIDPNADLSMKGLTKVLDWTHALAAVLNRLLSPAWWRRLGVGALGLVLIAIAVVLLVASSKTGQVAMKGLAA